MQARYSMLEKLAADKADSYNVVFMDPDIFVIGDLSELFTYEFDYAATISEGEAQPINGAMHFVRAGNYAPAIRILKDVLKGWVHTCCSADAGRHLLTHAAIIRSARSARSLSHARRTLIMQYPAFACIW